MVAEALQTGSVTFRTSEQSARDYIAIKDVCGLLSGIARRGRQRLYNVASGQKVTNGRIAELIGKLAGVRTNFVAGAPKVDYPDIVIDRIRSEFSFNPSSIESCLGDILVSRQQPASPI